MLSLRLYGVIHVVLREGCKNWLGLLVGVEVEVGGQNGEEASEGLSKF